MTTSDMRTAAPSGSTFPQMLDNGDRQQVFRTMLAALSEPGTLQTIPPLGAAGMSGADRTADLPMVCAPMIALSDLLTPIAAITGDHQAADLVRVVAGITHAPVDVPERSRYVLSCLRPATQAMERLCRGTTVRPHLAATLCQAVDWCAAPDQQPADRAIDADGASDAVRLALRGPGVPGWRQVAIGGLDESFFLQRSALNREFPQGVDMLLIDPAGTVVGLPRTTRVEVIR